jgi:Transposase IS4
MNEKVKTPAILSSTKASFVFTIGKIKGKVVPAAIDSYNYNHSINGCDKADQMLGSYGMHKRKSRKWWNKILLTMLEATTVNAYFLYRFTRSPTVKKYNFSLKKLKLQLSDEFRKKSFRNDARHHRNKGNIGPTKEKSHVLEGEKHIIR